MDLPPQVAKHCRPGMGADTCRYLLMGGSGWECGKLMELAAELDRRVAAGTMNARGDNCAGHSLPLRDITP